MQTASNDNVDSVIFDSKSVFLSTLILSILSMSLLRNYNVWYFIPKVSIWRYPILEFEISTKLFNVTLIILVIVLLCFYLELRERSMDELLEYVYEVNRQTDLTLRDVSDRNNQTLKKCINLIDASSEHYEQAMLLKREWASMKTAPGKVISKKKVQA